MRTPEITGGADQDEAAAIGAVIANVLAEEEADRAAPPVRPRQSDWVLAWRPRNVLSAVPAPVKRPNKEDSSSNTV